MFKPRKFQEALPVEYTPSELAALADQADELVSEMERLEQLKAALPKKIESIKEQVYDVSKKRKAGFRDKLVDCETVADANLPEVITIRLDTGEEIGRRAMTESERQEDLFPEQAEETKGQSEEERERLHKEAVAKWRREPAQATAELEEEIEAEEDAENDYAERGANKWGVYEQAIIGASFKADTAKMEIRVFQDLKDGLWRTGYSCQTGTGGWSGGVSVKSDGWPTKEEAVERQIIRQLVYLKEHREVAQNQAEKERTQKLITKIEARKKPVIADPHPEIEARAEDDSEWNALLDQAEAELEAEEAAKPNWQTRMLGYDDYLAYALSTGIKNPQSHAQKWHLTQEHEADVRQFLGRQAEQESEPDNFTADKCMECKSIDGAHAIDCTFHPDFALNITPKKTRKGNSIQPRSHA